MAAALLVGCQRDFHDPLLRQQLTTMIADLNDVPAAKKALGDVDAILSVNAAKLSATQKQKLTSARDALTLAINLHETKLSTDAAVRSPLNYATNEETNFSDYWKDLKEAQKLITEAASTF